MKILLLGSGGQVGGELRLTLAPLGELAAVDVPEVDLADPDSVCRCLRRHRPELVVNAAAYTAVDRAEEEEDLATAVNGVAPGVLAEELARTGGALVHYSTDYVFDGEKGAPYREEDPVGPLNAYGRSKLAGEEAVRSSGVPHLLLRTSWVYGARGANFLLTILRLAREREELTVVDDQVGAPTWSREIAAATARILRTAAADGPEGLREQGGLFHLTAAGSTTWFGFARAALDLFPAEGLRLKKILPIETSRFPRPARRPRNSRLDCSAVFERFGTRLPPWDESLKNVMAEVAGGAG